MAPPTVSIISKDGSSAASHPLPAIFSAPIRPDVVTMTHTGLAKNKRQPYSVSEKAGHQTSAVSIDRIRQFRSQMLTYLTIGILGYRLVLSNDYKTTRELAAYHFPRSCRRPYPPCLRWWYSQVSNTTQLSRCLQQLTT